MEMFYCIFKEIRYYSQLSVSLYTFHSLIPLFKNRDRKNMKIRIIVKFDDHEKHFFVACGTGEKTFKWLANVASQRYATAIPNGNLRRREDFCGVSEAAQFQTYNMILPTGLSPSPMELLTEHLHDEDTVIIELCSRLPIDQKTGTPKQSQFATLAYTTSQEKLGLDHEDFISEEGSRTQSELLSRSAGSKTPISSPTARTGPIVPETPAQQIAKANFIRIIIKSQTLNEIKIEEDLHKHWNIISASLKKMNKTDDIQHIQTTFFHHWDMLIDIFEFYSSNNPNHHSNQAVNPHSLITSLSFTTHYYEQIINSYYLEKNDFINFIEDANIFPAIQLQSQCNLIFQKTCQLLTEYSQQHHFTQQTITALNFTGFLIALLLCSQLKYNDTLDAKVTPVHAYDSIDRLVHQNLFILARHLNCRALLKKDFLTNPVLARIKDNYDILQTNFDKIASKTKDVPLTITMEDMMELLYNSTLLLKKDDIDYIKILLIEIRKGNVYGRDIDNIESESMKNLLLQQQEKQNNNFYYDNNNNNNSSSKNNKDHKDSKDVMRKDELYPSTEFTFPEFLEGIARSGYYFYTKTTPLNPIITQSIVNIQNGTLIEDPREIAKIEISDYLIKGIQDVSDFLTGKKLKPQQGGGKKGKKGAAANAATASTTSGAEAK